MRRLSTQADDDNDDEGNDRIIVDGDHNDDDKHNIEIRDFDTQFLVDSVVPVGNITYYSIYLMQSQINVGILFK